MTDVADSFGRRFGLTVNPANVLDVRAVILGEAARLTDVLRYDTRTLRMPRLGGDPVSGDMSEAFDETTGQLLGRIRAEIDKLTALGAELAAAARAYGIAEERIGRSFARTDVGQLPPLLRRLGGLSAADRRPPPGSLTDLLTGVPR